MTTALPTGASVDLDTPGGAAHLPVLVANPGLGQRSGQAVKGARVPHSPRPAPSSLLQKATPGTSQPAPSCLDSLC